MYKVGSKKNSVAPKTPVTKRRNPFLELDQDFLSYVPPWSWFIAIGVIIFILAAVFARNYLKFFGVLMAILMVVSLVVAQMYWFLPILIVILIISGLIYVFNKF